MSEDKGYGQAVADTLKVLEVVELTGEESPQYRKALARARKILAGLLAQREGVA